MASKICDSYLAPWLVPAIFAVNIHRLQDDDKSSSKLYLAVALATMISSISTMIQNTLKRYGPRSKKVAIILTAILLTIIPIIAFIIFNFIPNYRADIPSALIVFIQSIFSIILYNGLRCKSKRYFSFGEASIICQLSSAALTTYMFVKYSEYIDDKLEISMTTEIVLTIGSSLFFIAFVPLYLLNLGQNTLALGTLITLSIASAYSSIQNILIVESDLDPLTWLAAHLGETQQRINLFILWVLTLTACVSLSASWARLVGTTNCLIRKTFHVAICIVFISGYNQDLEFASFAAGGILCIMFVLELCRAWNLKLVGPYLEKVCSSLRGGWDNNYLTLSHIYLLAGAFVPLWLLPGNSSKLAISSGLISLGIGDTAAAVVGTFMGRTPIMPSSKKTVEGFLGNFIAMFLFKQYWIGNQDFPNELAFVYVAMITSAIEVITNNCDNLILPLVMTLLNLMFEL